MKVQDIIDYVLNTPGNTNSEILKEMIEGWGDLQKYVEQLEIERLDEYLYYATYDSLNYTLAKKYAKNFKTAIGGCSAIRKDNFLGRTYDWFYDYTREFVVRTLPNADRHESIAVCAAPKEIQPGIIEENKYIEEFEVIPFMALDGMNDAGVYCEINVVPPGDKGYTIDSNPGKTQIHGVHVVRYILDYANSARDAVNRIMNDISICGIYTGDINEELHYMIADKDATYIVEFINGKAHILSSIEDEFDNLPNDKAIMTNFHLTGFDGNIITGFDIEGGITPEDTTLEPHAMGTERYQILLDNYDSIENEEDMMNLMEQIIYTNAYDETKEPYWYSELVGPTKHYGDLTIYDNKDKYTEVKNIFIEQFKNRDRNTGKSWQTVHTSTYKINEKKLFVTPQEGYDIFEFELGREPIDTIVYDGGKID